MSGPWRPIIFQGQNLAEQIEENNRERAAEVGSSTPYTDNRYQPIAPYGGVNLVNTNQRRRTGRACDECRRKKIKCYSIEGSSSCKNCISYQKGCTYDTSVKKRGPPRGYINTLENRLKRIEGLIDTMSHESDQHKPATASNKPSTSPTTDHYSSNDDDNSCGDEEEKEEGSNRKKQKVIDNSNQIGTKNPSNMIDAIKNTHLTANGRFISGNSMGSLFSRKIKSIHEKELTRHGVEIQHNGVSDDYYIKRVRSSDDRRRDQLLQLVDLGVIRSTAVIKNVDDWIWRVAGIKKDLSDRLLKVYFAFIHPLLPVVNKVEFLKEYRGIDASYPAGPLINAVYGAAVRYIENCKRFGDENTLDEGGPWDFPDNLAAMLFQNLIIFIKGKYDPCLSTIQAIVIAHNHSANVENWTSGWLLNCIAVRMSQDIGLHRSSDGWNISQQEKETRRMVWWQVYLLDRWFSAGTGRPLTAFDEDCDELYPTENVSIYEIMDTMTAEDQHLPRFPSLDPKVAAKATDSKIPMNQPFLQLLKLSEILGRILQGLYTPKAKKHGAKHGSDAIVGYLDDALSKWRAALPPLLEISSAGKRSSLTEEYVPLLSMSGLLSLSYCTLLILLHRPFIEKGTVASAAAENSSSNNNSNNTNNKKQKLSSQSALTICTSAAIRIVELSESMHYRDFFMVSWGFALYPVFTAALIHIYNATNSDSIISDVAKSNLVRALQVVDKLCLLSPMAAGMGNILKKIVALSSIFKNDPDFISTVNIKKKSDDFTPFTTPQQQNHTSTIAESETQKQQEENGSAINNENNTSPLAGTTSGSPVVTDDTKTKASNESQRRVGKKAQLPDWSPADSETIRSQWLPNNNEHVNKKRALDISAPSWEDDNWLNQLYAPTPPNFYLTKENSNAVNNSNNSSTALSFNPSNCLPNCTAEQLYQRQFSQQSNDVDIYSIRQFGLDTMLVNDEFPTNALDANVSASFAPPATTQLPPKKQHKQLINDSNRSILEHQKRLSLSSSPNNLQQQHDNVVPSLSVSQQQQQQSANNAATTAPDNTFAEPLSSPSTLFELSDFSYPFFYGAPPANNGISSTTTANTSFYNSTVTANNNPTTGPANANTLNDPSALFRLRMENPFWGIPTSMEVDDWQAYLLPHQQQQEQLQQQQQQRHSQQ